MCKIGDIYMAVLDTDLEGSLQSRLTKKVGSIKKTIYEKQIKNSIEIQLSM